MPQPTEVPYNLPEPAEPNYAPSYTVEEQLARPERPTEGVELFAAPPLFTPIWDDGWNRWLLAVLPGQPGVCTIQLQVSGPPETDITWWKKINIHSQFFGQWWHIRSLTTQDAIKSNATDLTPDVSPGGTLKLDFWKAGFLGIGTYIFTQYLHLPTYVGNRVIYLCNKDHPNQP
jgi:hypothetical protein